MANNLRTVWLIVTLILVLGACSDQTVSLSEQQAVDKAWQALEPNTSSHDRTHWELGEVRQVLGQEVTAQFGGDPAPGCLGPKPPANGEIQSSRSYWYVQLKPRPATPLPEAEISPTAPPAIPEPFTRQALFLVDPTDGSIVARKLFCVIY
jgi:hypothetical protein